MLGHSKVYAASRWHKDNITSEVICCSDVQFNVGSVFMFACVHIYVGVYCLSSRYLAVAC